MGYNVSRHSVVRNLPQLRQLAELRTTTTFPAENPKRLAYKLREAIYAAGQIDEFRTLYEQVWPFYHFREETGAVVAEYSDDYTLGEAGDKIKSPSRSRTGPPDKKTIPGTLSLLDILATVLKFDAEVEIYFPNTTLNEEDKLILYEWTEDKTWQYIDHSIGGGTGLTLTKKDVPEGILWTPAT